MQHLCVPKTQRPTIRTAFYEQTDFYIRHGGTVQMDLDGYASRVFSPRAKMELLMMLCRGYSSHTAARKVQAARSGNIWKALGPGCPSFGRALGPAPDRQSFKGHYSTRLCPPLPVTPLILYPVILFLPSFDFLEMSVSWLRASARGAPLAPTS